MGAEQPPNAFICPLTLDLVENPMMVSNGRSYEASSLDQLFNQPYPMDAIKREPLDPNIRIPNLLLKRLIDTYNRTKAVDAGLLRNPTGVVVKDECRPPNFQTYHPTLPHCFLSHTTLARHFTDISHTREASSNPAGAKLFSLCCGSGREPGSIPVRPPNFCARIGFGIFIPVIHWRFGHCYSIWRWSS
jgi:hypothetical protein